MLKNSAKYLKKKREKQEFKLNGLYYVGKTLQFSCDDENMKVRLNNDQILTYNNQEVQLTYKKKGGKGKIIMKRDGLVISYPLDEEAQEIIEKCFTKAELENGGEIEIDAQKFEKIFEKTNINESSVNKDKNKEIIQEHKEITHVINTNLSNANEKKETSIPQ